MNITNKIKSAFGLNMNTEQVKLLKTELIEKRPVFEKMHPMKADNISSITSSMKKDGFKAGHDIHIWYTDGHYIVIDGHTRLHCWTSLGNTSISCVIHPFNTEEEAIAFAMREQTDRRNLSGKALLAAIAQLDAIQGKAEAGKGKSSEVVAKQLGISDRTVEKARVVNAEATPEQKEAISSGELSINQAYNQIRDSKKPVTEKVEEVSKEKQKKSKPSKPKTDKPPRPKATDKAFADGIRYAISKIYDGTELETLYQISISEIDAKKFLEEMKSVDFISLFSKENA